LVVTAGLPDTARRIAILLPSLNGGGAERVALFLVEVLAEAGYTVDLVVAVNKGALVDHPVARRHLVDLGARNEMLSAPHIARYCRRAKPDLLIAFVHSAKIMAGLARKIAPSIPLAISVHAALDIPQGSRFWFRRWLGHGPERWLYRDVLGCHVVSAALREQVLRHFAIAPDRVEVIYNPIREPGPAPLLPAEHRGWFDRPVLMTAGRLVPQKNHATLIEAFARSGLKGRARLLLLGEGALESQLQAQVAALGLQDDVLFGGFQPDIRPYLRRSHGFFLSSTFEGFAIVLAEALREGVPVAAFDCPSGPREVLEDGRMGQLIVPADVEGLADAMCAVMDGKKAAMPPDRVAQSLERFSPARIAQEYLGFVRRCLDRAPGNPGRMDSEGAGQSDVR
jgi:glycosyltransferase involved in cell wall biosynthesis